jgi:hypothetical protein
VRARTSSSGSPGRPRYSSPHLRTRSANRSCEPALPDGLPAAAATVSAVGATMIQSPG